MNLFGKNLALWIIIALLVVALFNLFQSPSLRGPSNQLAYSDFVAKIESGDVVDVTIQGNSITGHSRDGRAFSTYNPDDSELISGQIRRWSDVGAACTSLGLHTPVRGACPKCAHSARLSRGCN